MLGASVDATVLSFEVDAVKPEQRIFERLCAELDVPARSVVFVDDSLDCDVRGAAAAGMTSLRIR